MLCAFDLLELDGACVGCRLRCARPGWPSLLGAPRPGIALNTHYVGEGEIVYQQARKLGCEVEEEWRRVKNKNTAAKHRLGK